MLKLLMFISISYLLFGSLWAQSEADQPTKTNPLFIEIDRNQPKKYPSPHGVEMPANSLFHFDYRFYTIIETNEGTKTGYFDIDSKTGTILTRLDDMDADAYMLKTPAGNIYNYVIADGQKVLMEFHSGYSSFDTYFQNIANTRNIQFNNKKLSNRLLKKPSGGSYFVYEQTISTHDGFAVLFFTPSDFEVNSTASTDPLCGLGIIYDDVNKNHFLLVGIESENMSATINMIQSIKTTFNGATYKKLSEFFPDEIAGEDATQVEKHISNVMKEDIATYKSSNNIADLARAGQIYSGGDTEFQIFAMDERLRELNDDLKRNRTENEKKSITEEKLKVEKALSLYKIHLQQIQSKSPQYWEKNAELFFELKTRQAEEIHVIMESANH